MSDIDEVKNALNDWLTGLDNGEIEKMLATCDPEVIICNEHQPTTVGVQAVRDKYAPRIEAGVFKSTFETQHIKVYGDLAMIVGHYGVDFTNKTTGEKGGGSGRLALVYRKHPDGSWKLLLDIDNND
ncbi:YybH family protein [Agarilytica rhodophyticola]|uniref:YybH family protein n=1 Tax=Agarilytica rhodophyticola TaxID=1737490 RepID=UPI000B3462DB|nr:DUF4440 domain-containing protein [Agarilytica rhodophyticola]